MLTACADSQQNDAKEYAQRVANVLDIDLSGAIEPVLTFPSSSELTISPAQHKLSIREFMSMRQCKLHTIVASKNSQMGRLAPASQVLFSDLQVLRYGPECVAQLRGDDQLELADKLERYLSSKETLIEEIMWQAILGSSENAKFWSRSKRIDNYPDELSVDPLQSIESLQRLIEDVQDNHYSVSPQRELEIEDSLRNLSYADGGLLLQRLARVNAGLGMADELIQQALLRPLCFDAKPNQKSNFLKNVVLKFFIGQVQPRLVKLLQRYQQLMPHYLQLENLLSDSAPPAYQQWQKQRQNVFEQAHNSAKRHVANLQQIFTQCGIQLN
ncbi:DUF3080 domain-containing protein [Arenicella sp.]|nr:DUF3080 domain-containing protein [Arenicella sp.]